MNCHSTKLVASLLLVIVGCSTTTVRQNPNFAARRQQMRMVAVVPPEVKIQLITFKGDNPSLPEEEANVRGRLPDAVAKAFEGRRFIVHRPDVFQASGSSDLALRATQANGSFVEAAHEAYSGQAAVLTSTAEKYQRSLGPSVAALADHAASDGLVFVELEGFRKSGGEVALDFAKSVVIGVLTGVVAVSPMKGGVLFIALVDGTNGDVLWQNIAATQLDVTAPGVVEAMVQQAVSVLPADAGAPAENGERLRVASMPAAPPAVPVEQTMVKPIAVSAAQPLNVASSPAASTTQDAWSAPTDCWENVSLSGQPSGRDDVVTGRLSVIGANPIKNVSVCASGSCDVIEGGRVMSGGENTTFTVKSVSPGVAKVTVVCSVLRRN